MDTLDRSRGDGVEAAIRPSPPVPPQRRRRWGLVAVAVVVMAAAMAAAASVHIGTVRRLERVRSEQAAVAADEVIAGRDVSATSAELVRARGRFERVSSRLADARDLLAVRGAELTAVRAQQRAVRDALVQARSELEAVFGVVLQQSAGIDALQRCLSDVNRALNQVVFDDPSGASATLAGSAADCAAASLAVEQVTP